MIKSSLVTGLATLVLLGAGAATAECDKVQETIVGRAIASTAQSDLADLVNAAQKPVIDILNCEGGSREFEARFRYSQIDAEGHIVWIEGMALGKDDKVREIHYRKSSPQLEALIETPHKMAGL